MANSQFIVFYGTKYKRKSANKITKKRYVFVGFIQNNGLLNIGQAICNENEDRYEKKEGRVRATGNSVWSPTHQIAIIDNAQREFREFCAKLVAPVGFTDQQWIDFQTKLNQTKKAHIAAPMLKKVEASALIGAPGPGSTIDPDANPDTMEFASQVEMATRV